MQDCIIRLESWMVVFLLWLWLISAAACSGVHALMDFLRGMEEPRRVTLRRVP